MVSSEFRIRTNITEIWIGRLGKSALSILTGLVLLLLYTPIIMIALLSVFDARRGRILWDTFSIDSYGAIGSNTQLMSALGNSLVVGFVASIVAIVLAIGFSFATFSQRQSKATKLLEFLIFLPFILPPIVTGLSLLITFKELEIPRGLFAVTVGHTVFILAITYSTISTRLRSIGTTLAEASLDLGATKWQTLRFIILPQMSSALLVAGMLSFALSLDETMISLFLVGDTSTLPIRLYSLMRVGFSPEVNALVTLILIFTIGIAVVFSRSFVLKEEIQR